MIALRDFLRGTGETASRKIPLEVFSRDAESCEGGGGKRDTKENGVGRCEGGGRDGARHAEGKKYRSKFSLPRAPPATAPVYIVHGPFNSQMRRRFSLIPGPFRCSRSCCVPSRFLAYLVIYFFSPRRPARSCRAFCYR